jgi:putative transposase
MEGLHEGLPDVGYPFHDKTVTITNCGRICIEGQKNHLSTVFAGHDVGVLQVEDDVWLVSFIDHDLAGTLIWNRTRCKP